MDIYDTASLSKAQRLLEKRSRKKESGTVDDYSEAVSPGYIRVVANINEQ